MQYLPFRRNAYTDIEYSKLKHKAHVQQIQPKN